VLVLEILWLDAHPIALLRSTGGWACPCLLEQILG
jgi:hypothetical protein